MKFYFSVRGDKITAREDYRFVEGNRGVYEAVFEFDDAWRNEYGEDRFDRMCIVCNNGVKGLPVPITKNNDGEWMCKLPLLANGSAKVGVVGLDGEEDSVCPRISTNWESVNVGKGAANDDNAVDIDETVAKIWQEYYLQMAEKADAAEQAAEDAKVARDEAEGFSSSASDNALLSLQYKDEAEMLRNEALGFSESSRIIAENMQKDAEEIITAAETYRDEASTNALKALDSAQSAEREKEDAESAAKSAYDHKESAKGFAASAEVSATSIKNLSVEAAEGDVAGVEKTETDDGIKLSFTLPKGEKGDIGPQGTQGAKGEKGDPGYTPQKGVDYFTPADIEGLKIPIVDEEINLDSGNAVQNKVVALHINTLYAESGNLHSNVADIETRIGNIDAALEELHNYAQALIGGEA